MVAMAAFAHEPVQPGKSQADSRGYLRGLAGSGFGPPEGRSSGIPDLNGLSAVP